MGNRDRQGYQTDVTDEEWSFVALYLALCREDATIAWLLWYNQTRMHSTLNYASPIEFE